MADQEINYPKLTFYVDVPAAKDYSYFLERLRNILTGSTLGNYNLPILPSESEAQGKHYCFVDLSYNSKVVTVAFDVVNLNLIAYNSYNESHYFSNTKDTNVFEGHGMKVYYLFTNTYADLGDRAVVKLGKCALQNAVTVLTTSKTYDMAAHKTSIITIMGMVLEATKSKRIEDELTKDFNKDILLNYKEISYEDNWPQLSKNIQRENPGILMYYSPSEANQE